MTDAANQIRVLPSDTLIPLFSRIWKSFTALISSTFCFVAASSSRDFRQGARSADRRCLLFIFLKILLL